MESENISSKHTKKHAFKSTKGEKKTEKYINSLMVKNLRFLSNVKSLLNFMEKSSL